MVLSRGRGVRSRGGSGYILGRACYIKEREGYIKDQEDYIQGLKWWLYLGVGRLYPGAGRWLYPGEYMVVLSRDCDVTPNVVYVIFRGGDVISRGWNLVISGAGWLYPDIQGRMGTKSRGKSSRCAVAGYLRPGLPVAGPSTSPAYFSPAYFPETI